MEATSVHPQPDGESLPAAIKCVIVYEDFDTGIRARRFAQTLADKLGMPCDCESLWRSEVIELLEIGNEVARDAAASDFVILALRGERHLSLPLKRWIESWLTLGLHRDSSVVALFAAIGSTAHGASATRYFLRERCAQAGIAFFACCCASRNDEPSSTSAPNGSAVIEERLPRRRIASARGLRQRPAFA